MLDYSKVEELEDKYTLASEEQDKLCDVKMDVARELSELFSEELGNGEILIDTRWSQRGYDRYTSDTLKMFATTSANNNDLKDICQRLYDLDITEVYFGPDDAFSLRILFGDLIIRGEKDELIAFCCERNMTITDNAYNKRIKELKDIIEQSEEELAAVRAEKNELNKKKREAAKRLKEDAQLSDEWFDGK